MDDNFWMQFALREAGEAYRAGEVPVGAVVVLGNVIIGRGHNSVETLHDPTAHAEMLAITAAAETLKSWRLIEARLYVTLEPCHMCAGAAVLARLQKIVFGAWDPKAGACGSLAAVTQDERLNHQVEIVPEVMEAECGDLLKRFFKELREKRLAAAKGETSAPSDRPGAGDQQQE
ncbi:MAG: nucleoside deaminase [Candidatus Delongbacteria bacterium]|nr:nucleoside deaminase [Candidatus Delongbacteria bacterium]